MITQSQLQNFAFQFITHFNATIDYYSSALLALDGGCRWIQLRMKDAVCDDVCRVADKLLPICRAYDATFIIDDHVEIAKSVGADGVHLGKNDMPIAEARSILGKKFIIGATCNTFEEIREASSIADYVGCGPFRLTQTKKNLAPTLGLDGYRQIVWRCREQQINIPIVAIGGITLADINDVLDAGPNGIAVSSVILNSPNPTETTSEIVKLLNDRKTL